MKKYVISLLTCTAFGAAHAAVIVSDDFSYADGALVGNGGWASHSGTAGTLLVAGGAAQVSQDSGSEDANLGYGTSYSTGIVTASFDIFVTAASPIGGGDYEYFAHFKDAGFGFRSRIDLVAPTAGGDFTIGIATTSSTAEATLPTDFSFSSVVPVTITFDLDTGLSSLTAGGNTVLSTTPSLGDSVEAFGLRQSNSSSDELIAVDNLILSYDAPVPEPSSAVLGSLALLGLIRRKR
ncbi:MAG: PEP-CTERM sorting domain-containing protein [Verrucomicrobiaceae bacterium]